MKSTYSIINPNKVKDISADLLREDGKLKLLPASEYDKFDKDDLRHFCHVHARYGLPTVELVNYIKEIIDNRSAIEIGAGCGDLGFHLGIKMTDSKLQDTKEIATYYNAIGQPTIKYPDDVIRLEALDAVYKYKPKVVVGSWITPYAPKPTEHGSSYWGIKEDKILRLVETFIIVGNLDIHGSKPIRQYTHKTVHSPWIKSRAKNPYNNCIFIWDKR